MGREREGERMGRVDGKRVVICSADLETALVRYLHCLHSTLNTHWINFLSGALNSRLGSRFWLHQVERVGAGMASRRGIDFACTIVLQLLSLSGGSSNRGGT